MNASFPEAIEAQAVVAPEVLARRQYVLSSSSVPEWAGAQVVRVATNCFLHHCSSLPVSRLQDAQGTVWLLLGIAIPTGSEECPATTVPGLDTAAVREASIEWAGRWLLIGNGQIQPDAAALLRCFYIPAMDNASRVWASSSLALLAAVAPDAVGTESSFEFHHQQSIEWYPLPQSRFEGVRQLLPTQNLSIETRQSRFNGYGGVIEPQPYDEVLRAFQARLVAFFERVRDRWSPLHLPLTAGLDSRVLLAAAGTAGCPVKCFTQEHQKMHRHDRTIPKRVARKAGVSYRLITPGPPDPSRQRLYDAFTHRTYATIVRETFVNQQYEGIEAGLLLRGNCFEVGRRGYGQRFLRKPHLTRLEQITYFFKMEAGTPLEAALKSWLKWIDDHPVPGLEWHDRFHIEQRLAGWYAAIEQALDLLPVDHVPPVNCLATYRLMLSLDPEVRQRGDHQRDMIRRLMPSLLKVPINPTSNWHMTARRRMRRGIRRIIDCVS